MEKPIITDKERIVELELQLIKKDGIIKALQDAFDKQLEIIEMLRDRIDELTPDIARKRVNHSTHPFIFYESSEPSKFTHLLPSQRISLFKVVSL